MALNDIGQIDIFKKVGKVFGLFGGAFIGEDKWKPAVLKIIIPGLVCRAIINRRELPKVQGMYADFVAPTPELRDDIGGEEP